MATAITSLAPSAWQIGTNDPIGVAQWYLDRYWNRQLPVDPVAIAQAAGVRVFQNPNLAPLSGCFYDEDGPVIEFNGREPLVRQRFTVAHELGHHALGHGPRFRDPSENFSLTAYDSKEVAANQFAAELLMPADVINHLIMKRKITDFDRLAALFNTSGVAMQFRLKNLGWL